MTPRLAQILKQEADLEAALRIAEATKHIRNRQDQAVRRFNLWAKEPTR